MVYTICVAIGLALYIYAEIIGKGASLANINIHKLIIGTVIFTVWQAIMLALGMGLAYLIEDMNKVDKMQEFTWMLSIFIFGILATRMIIKAWKKEPIVERREDVLIKRTLLRYSAKIGIQTGLMGLVLGFLDAGFINSIVVLALATIIVFVAALYSGYRFGCVYKALANIMGAICFIISDIYLIGCYFIGI